MEDSETETVSNTKGNTDPITSPVETPASPDNGNSAFLPKEFYHGDHIDKRPLSRYIFIFSKKFWTALNLLITMNILATGI